MAGFTRSTGEVIARLGKPVGRVQPANSFTASFPDTQLIKARIPAPIDRVDTLLHPTVKRRPRPILHTRHQAVLERIAVQVIEVPRIVALVTDQMFPEALLPERALALRLTSVAQQIRAVIAAASRMRDMSLDQPPAIGKVRIIGW